MQPAATRVRDPLSGRSVWLAGMVRNARRKGADLVYDLYFEPAHGIPDRQGVKDAIEQNLRGLGFTGKVYAMPAGSPPHPVAALRKETPGPGQGRGDPVKGMTGPGVQPHGGPIQKKPVEGVRHLVAVASGKGGVGKSTVATNLAVALHRLGHEVGLLDADVHGPSVPMMMDGGSRPLVDPATRRILPTVAHGVRCLSMGQLVDPEEAMIWRGPMVQGAVRQFLQDASWTGCAYLLVDLPPGTGDAQLTLLQAADLSGAVIVTTPQPVALADAIRGITMFRKLGVPLLGIVENMAWYELPDGGRDYVFGRDGGRRTAESHDTELLAQIPLRSRIRESGDTGRPVALGDGPEAELFLALARRIAAKLPIELAPAAGRPGGEVEA